MKRLYTLVFFIFCVQVVFAQSPFFQPYFLLKKNEPVKINKILQDKTGFVWFATDRGLFKFDGIGYRRFLGFDNLPDENVTTLAQDSVGRLWVGFKNGKISIVENNSITSFEPAEGMPSQPISDILFDKEGVLWFSTLNDGVYYYINSRLYRLDDIDGMPDLFCYDIEEDASGNIWVGTDGGIAICTRKGNSVEINTVNYSSGLPDNIIKKITRRTDGKMWIATEDAGVICYDPKSKKNAPALKEKWNSGSISDFLIVDDWMWVATTKGLLSVDLSNGTSSSYSSDPTTSLYNDVEGSIWIGSKTGLQRTLGKQLQFFGMEGWSKYYRCDNRGQRRPVVIKWKVFA